MRSLKIEEKLHYLQWGFWYLVAFSESSLVNRDWLSRTGSSKASQQRLRGEISYHRISPPTFSASLWTFSCLRSSESPLQIYRQRPTRTNIYTQKKQNSKAGSTAALRITFRVKAGLGIERGATRRLNFSKCLCFVVLWASGGISSLEKFSKKLQIKFCPETQCQ